MATTATFPSTEPTSTLDDDQLMIRIQSGDRDAFDELVERHQSSVIGFLFRNTRDIQLAEDLAQETFLRLYDNAWDFLPRGKFRGFMFRVARNLLIDVVRRQTNDVLVKAVKGSADGDSDAMARLVGEEATPETHARRRELRELIDELLAEIPEDQRLTFTLHHFAELPLAEVADVMETNVATTKSRLRLAREKLQDKLLTRGFTDPARGDSDDEAQEPEEARVDD
ncbi:MAG: sigma-70 family RNA polymerase sigma factor [Planctomycetaceae bacterium]|nr:sigma-70 family RNA polymerase sigma factor [Planctomycetaceae bacterium]